MTVTYTLSFESQFGNAATGSTLSVLIDGNQVGLRTNVGTDTGYVLTTLTFTPTTASAILTFQFTNPASSGQDLTTYLDAVSVTA